ncbi:MarR family winged helix-turn-helix transcriptional regulator [Lipingzhangella sp. LS1_29]|uniref:MarR family winged helix-turn-helix transcriptional regulator n=1 Tax=Lipingzhangella rawalii TaxID=2055835 RepID=A0ABU2H2W5_9ACTN|nr:MarR family winged helix-turn-helix transcriptional regulator [Lipingzhangella rawalii]MDS1269641.1 MarR family winged helix-turn-helix transcriptional regulator [Lipingzhangella rawalii]
MNGDDRSDSTAVETGRTADPGTPSTPPELMAAPGYLVRRLYQAYIAVWAQTVDATLTGPQFAVLTAIRHYPGVDQGSLASVTALDRSTMADISRRLEDRGLIRRETSPTDTRRKLLHLTEHGATVLTETNHRARELDERLLAGYPPEAREQLMNQLTRLAHDWEDLSQR